MNIVLKNYYKIKWGDLMKGFKVLMYHEIIKREDFDYSKYKGIKVKQNYQDRLPPALFTYLEEFERQMKYLYDEGYTTLKLEDIVDFYYGNKELPEKSVLLTFDDMYKSVLLYAYPILKKYKFNGVGFVVKDWLFDEVQSYSIRESVCLCHKELNEMTDVFEYANHTNSLHKRDGGVTALQNVDKDLFIEDIKACEEYVDTKHVFAYPFGIYTDGNIDWLKEEEFLLAFTSKGGKNTKDTNPYKLNRNGIFIDCDFENFNDIIME